MSFVLKEFKIGVGIYLLLLISITFLMIGSSFNFQVVQANQGKMPVLLAYYLNTETHFSFWHHDEVKLWYLADIFYLFDVVYSIGDVFLILGLMLFSYSSMYIGVSYIKQSKCRKYTKVLPK